MKAGYVRGLLFALFSMTLLFEAVALDNEVQKRPNILLIVLDDTGYSDIGVYGGEIPTENIDELSRSGLRFINFHMSPTCSASRSMMLTGIDHHLTGLGTIPELKSPVFENKPGYEGYLLNNNVTVATLLRDAGYHTYMVGKWQLGEHNDNSPHARGFEETFALMEGAGNHFNGKGFIPSKPVSTYRENGIIVERPDNIYSTELWTQKMLEMIDKNHGDGKSFFAYIAFTTNHWPLQAPKDDIEKFMGKYDMGWDKLRQERFERMKYMGLIGEDVKLPPKLKVIPQWDSLSDEEKKFQSKKMAIYAAMVHNQDRHVGIIIDHLKKIGEYKDTYIFFASDNGVAITDPSDKSSDRIFREWVREYFDNSYENLGSASSFIAYGMAWAQASVTPLPFFKGFVAEGGTRVPFIVHSPNMERSGKVSGAFADAKDLAATFLDIAGVKHPGQTYKGRCILPMQGVSMLDHINGKTFDVHDKSDTVGFELFGSKALIQGRWKITYISEGMYGEGKWHLYDLKKDPSEQQPLEYEQPELFVGMLNAYEKYEKENGIVVVPFGWNPWSILR